MKILNRLSLSLLLALPLAVNAAPRPATPFTDAELDALLAPVALYPDTVLSHVLIAATVPEDVEAAAQWIERHPDRRGQEAVDAVQRYDWDPSVKALVAFPEVIERMDEDSDWTEDLGLAFLEQEATVMDRVQFLRDRAYENGSLDDIEQVRVVREREYIYIEPAVSRVVYVPYYDPLRVYGDWWWPSYPPHYWSWWAGYPARHYYGSTFFWGVRYHLGSSWYVGSFNWPHRHVVVTRPHRHYAPTPGYSGRSMRRDVVRHDTPSPRHGSRGWRHDSRSVRPGATPRPDRAIRRGHDRRDGGSPHVAQAYRPRRDWSEVREALATRRSESSRSIRTAEGSRGDAERPRVSRRYEGSQVRNGVRPGAPSRFERRGSVAKEAPRAPRTSGQPRQRAQVVRPPERAQERSAVRAAEPRAESRGHSRGDSRNGGDSERGGGRGNEGRTRR